MENCLRPDEFYRRMNPKEALQVRQVVDWTNAYAVLSGYKPLIAGVGGILRREDPAKARDIDLVVVGTPDEKFYKTLHEYGRFIEKIADIELFESVYDIPHRVHKYDLGFIRPCGSEGHISSRGFQISLPDIRPIDMQFVKDETIESWIAKQEQLRNPEPGKSDLYPYARLV